MSAMAAKHGSAPAHRPADPNAEGVADLCDWLPKLASTLEETAHELDALGALWAAGAAGSRDIQRLDLYRQRLEGAARALRCLGRGGALSELGLIEDMRQRLFAGSRPAAPCPDELF